MGRRPPQGCGLRALPAPLPLPLLLLLLLRPPATPGVTCPPPTSVEHADIRVKSYKLNSTERYTCNTGFKRKAGTSTLTECVLNKTTNTAHWTIPNLKCITSSEASLHPQAHKCHVVMLSLGDPSLTHLKPSSTEMPAGVTPEPESTSLSGKGTYSYSSGTVTAAIVMPVAVLCVVCVGLLVCYKRSRQTSQIRTVAMENMEEIPMTGGTNGRDEDAENQAYNLGNSRGKLRAAKAEARMPTLP
ncbi:interleukin-15 receptor subunit alpha isoform X8 [Neofelis nebulosa]|uniref:interleukin-15 receptor subunit alpha isoform X8 n=1 Tax=Neofelis nebulosa TaxID=61452 RepID=UPI00272CD0D0|nr:interleukin-15 receptor subunit alpha isoform X8 [Neofelis nebulosa]